MDVLTKLSLKYAHLNMFMSHISGRNNDSFLPYGFKTSEREGQLNMSELCFILAHRCTFSLRHL